MTNSTAGLASMLSIRWIRCRRFGFASTAQYATRLSGSPTTAKTNGTTCGVPSGRTVASLPTAARLSRSTASSGVIAPSLVEAAAGEESDRAELRAADAELHVPRHAERADVRADLGDRDSGGGGRVRLLLGYGPLSPDPECRPRDRPDAGGVHPARRRRGADASDPARNARDRRDVPQPGVPREGRDDARRRLRRTSHPRHRSGVERRRVEGVWLRLAVDRGAVRAARGRAPDLSRDVHAGADDVPRHPASRRRRAQRPAAGAARWPAGPDRWERRAEDAPPRGHVCRPVERVRRPDDDPTEARRPWA